MLLQTTIAIFLSIYLIKDVIDPCFITLLHFVFDLCDTTGEKVQCGVSERCVHIAKEVVPGPLLLHRIYCH